MDQPNNGVQPVAVVAKLTAKQEAALVRLAEGKSVVDSAKAAGVGRATLFRWLKNDPVFVAAYNAWKQEAMETARARLVALAGEAVTAVGGALEKGDVRTALTVLKALGLISQPKTGPTSVEEVKREQEVERKNREGALVRREMVAGFEDP